MVLRVERKVIERRPIARWLPALGSLGARIVIPVENLDPRVVLVPSLWVERVTDVAGPSGPDAGVGAGVTWSAYSAIRDSRENLRGLSVLPGFAARAVRPAAAWQSDGTLLAGDTMELSTGNAVLLVVACADVSGTLGAPDYQVLYFSLDAFPADALAESESIQGNREAYHGLLDRITCAVPSVVSVRSMGGEG
jgi:hypothetical protein